jgi:hypothetical protein
LYVEFRTKFGVFERLDPCTYAKEKLNADVIFFGIEIRASVEQN